MTRKMATIRKIEEIRPIPKADAIEAARVGGWWVVVKRGEFAAGDLAVYCEIDSFIPTAIAPFLTKPGQYPKEFESVEGERLRTVRLRGQISQGLLLPVQHIHGGLYWITNKNGTMDSVIEGDDVSEALGIAKYEAPIPANLAGEVRGVFPSWIPKTDQERVQNLSTELVDWQAQDLTWEVSEKLEGSSMTVYLRDDDFGVCSRNLDLREAAGNTLWAVARRLDLENLLQSTGRNLALQGELVGEGIQGNIYKLKGQRFYLFDIYDIDAGEYLSPSVRRALAAQLNIPHVPVLEIAAVLSDMQALLIKADGKSVMGDINGPWREGLVYKCNDMPVSFKTISNKYLMES